MAKKYISEKGLANRWDMSHRTLQDWRQYKSYNLPFVKIGRRVLYKIETIEAFEAEDFNSLKYKLKKKRIA